MEMQRLSETDFGMELLSVWGIEASSRRSAETSAMFLRRLGCF